VLRDMLVLADNASVSLRSARQRFPAPGLAGGRPGGLGTFIRNPGRANETRLGLTTSGTPLANGDMLRVMTPGGGGYGEPSRRDPEAVKRDLREGKITEQAAREIYGLK
jgi:N-methylhydantoinase B